VRQDALRYRAGKVESSLFRTSVALYGKNLCFSGADPGCFIPYKDFFLTRIPETGSNNKEGEKLDVFPFL
jgi:hypothetical protein